MSKPMDFWETHECHSLKDIQDCAAKNILSCRHRPLLKVKLENVVLDELHLMLRVTGYYDLINLPILQYGWMDGWMGWDGMGWDGMGWMDG